MIPLESAVVGEVGEGGENDEVVGSGSEVRRKILFLVEERARFSKEVQRQYSLVLTGIGWGLDPEYYSVFRGKREGVGPEYEIYDRASVLVTRLPYNLIDRLREGALSCDEPKDYFNCGVLEVLFGSLPTEEEALTHLGVLQEANEKLFEGGDVTVTSSGEGRVFDMPEMNLKLVLRGRSVSVQSPDRRIDAVYSGARFCRAGIDERWFRTGGRCLPQRDLYPLERQSIMRILAYLESVMAHNSEKLTDKDRVKEQDRQERLTLKRMLVVNG